MRRGSTPSIRCFGLVRISDVSRQENSGGARHIRDPMSQKPAGARFRHRQRLLACPSGVCTTTSSRLSAVAGENRRAQPFRDDRFRLRRAPISSPMIAQIHLSRTRAITELDPGNFEQALADRFFDERFAHARDPINPATRSRCLRNNFAEDRQDRILEHRLQLARRTGQQEDMRRFFRRSRLRGKIQAGGSSVFIRQDRCALRNVGLARRSIRQFEIRAAPRAL